MAFGVATKYRNSFWYLWSWELSGLTLSMGCMLAIIIILFHMNNRPLSAWDLPISLNTAISVFSALSQTSMMLSVAEGISQLKWIYFQQREHPLIHLQTFDEASRGPWGAMMFIWKIRWHALVASVGAVITILALAMQSFTQQTIKLPSRQVLTTDVRASVHASRSFDTGRPYLPLDNPAVALLDLTPVPVGKSLYIVSSRVHDKTHRTSERYTDTFARRILSHRHQQRNLSRTLRTRYPDAVLLSNQQLYMALRGFGSMQQMLQRVKFTANDMSLHKHNASDTSILVSSTWTPAILQLHNSIWIAVIGFNLCQQPEHEHYSELQRSHHHSSMETFAFIRIFSFRGKGGENSKCTRRHKCHLPATQACCVRVSTTLVRQIISIHILWGSLHGQTSTLGAATLRTADSIHR